MPKGKDLIGFTLGAVIAIVLYDVATGGPLSEKLGLKK